jgi:hypothetical protein
VIFFLPKYFQFHLANKVICKINQSLFPKIWNFSNFCTNDTMLNWEANYFVRAVQCFSTMALTSNWLYTKAPTIENSPLLKA